jgi:hypothetical protein
VVVRGSPRLASLSSLLRSAGKEVRAVLPPWTASRCTRPSAQATIFQLQKRAGAAPLAGAAVPQLPLGIASVQVAQSGR